MSNTSQCPEDYEIGVWGTFGNNSDQENDTDPFGFVQQAISA
jgi:hypothetical protein